MPSTFRKRLLLVPAALVPLAAVLLALWGCPRRPRLGPDWTPRRLYEALAESGLEYDAREILRGDPALEAGLYLKRPGDRRPCPELANPELASHPERWKGYVRVTRTPKGSEVTERGPNHCQLGPLLLVGDAEEIGRILEAVR
jgi:hypothetical protein